MSLPGFLTYLQEIWHYVAVALTLLIAVMASGHAILRKRDSRSAVLWVGLIWLAPVLGAVLYLTFGINRIRRLAVSLMHHLHPPVEPFVSESFGLPTEPIIPPAQLEDLARFGREVTHRLLVSGNRVAILRNGDEAFPAMIRAVRQARISVTLCTYIFDTSQVGLELVSALGDAVRRGVAVRVLVDATGSRYSWPPVFGKLRGEGIPHAAFLPPRWPFRPFSINLRNHRKILVVDGQRGFTGGMNIRIGHCLKGKPRRPVQDLHFEFDGPAVQQMQETFAFDWQFSTGEHLKGPIWFPPLEARGKVRARGISDGPDQDMDKLQWMLLGALSVARSSVRIVTPYFLPDAPLVAALNVAAMRGVMVDIVLTGANNLPFVHWATTAGLWQMVRHGCRVWVTPPPFDHTKLMVVDRGWALVGSANWDPRSLRLNFEFNMECHDPDLGAELDALIAAKIKVAHRLTLRQLDGRSLPVKLRDGAMRLFTPFL